MPSSCTRGACDGAWSGSSRCWNAQMTRRVTELTQIMEVMRMHETYYTPEQFAQLEARRDEIGADEIAIPSAFAPP